MGPLRLEMEGTRDPVRRVTTGGRIAPLREALSSLLPSITWPFLVPRSGEIACNAVEYYDFAGITASFLSEH